MECVVCNENIGREEAIWSCPDCFTIYHLRCVSSWFWLFLLRYPAIKNKQSTSSVSREWTCKYCNKENTAVPNRYFCYCGKKENPEFDPWLPPHSCGNLCGRTLPCGHVCNERCHAGPCPPCPRIVTISCPCGKTKRTVRCSLQHQESPENLCSLPCLKWLSCGKHRCRHKCHYGPCPDCAQTIHQTCFCGSESRDVPCGQDVSAHYSCGKICNKPLQCGHHVCSLPCHEGECPPCPTLPPRTCFCGKKQFDLPCTAATPSCHQTCDRLLACGHRCPHSCHPPPCPPCEQFVLKACRCGATQKQCKCSEVLLCTTRCNALKACGVHRCNRRCCDGQHAPCTQICNKPLSCGRHTCQLPCHSGNCPPCLLTVTITCDCGATTQTVLCKDYRRSLYPPCPQLCTKPSHCSHPHIQEHQCHAGKCPPCTLPCGKALPCGHTCSAICHEGEPCPPCAELVEIRCAGGHETLQVRCSEKNKVVCCDQPCGKLLSCGKHTCSLRCHSSETPCETCKQLCPGRPGCPHPCSRVFCHAGACDPCHQPVKRPCFCGKTSKTFECREVSGKSDSGFFSCGKVCGKPLQGCKHGCRLVCHEGVCGKCEQEIVAKCACGSRVERIQCWKAQQMEGYNAANVVQILLPCLDTCNAQSSTISQDKSTQSSKDSPSKPDQTISKPSSSSSSSSSSQLWLWIVALSVFIAVLSFLLRLFLVHCIVYCNKQ
ncbi:uncharacterized protein [Blastocystis hominis]|uniref:PHD-type domain-containing protein n=1 Tax=Blastocystis hominis TaxID=12968 RepID=D8LYV5_BLAHO|nr:uncharacterized protein [Blastocystis hominis]CBK20994.2 unnamed protein product [Blastocystis hominis]|eukprot:XP_012895042.1 uncharacterized protein [Blastocystis hominis]